MKLSFIISLAALAATAAAPVLFFVGTIPLETCKTVLGAATIAWFGSVVFWMKGE